MNKKAINEQNHIFIVGKYNGCSMYTSPSSLKNDNNELERIINKYPQIKRESVERTVFSKSTIEILKTNKWNTDFKTSRYASCEAKKIDSVIIINFLLDHKYSRKIWAMERIHPQLKITNGDFKSILYFSSDVVSQNHIIEEDENYFYEKLELGAENYNVGDTLCGRLAIRNINMEGELIIIRGQFKTIVEGESKSEKRIRLFKQRKMERQ